MSALADFERDERESATALDAYIAALRLATEAHVNARRSGTLVARNNAAMAERALRVAGERWARVVRGETAVAL